MSMQVTGRRDARQNQMSYINSTLVGGAGGLALKYLIPLSDEEKGIFRALRSEYTSKSFDNARRAMVDTLAEQNLTKKDPGVDLFVKRFNTQGKDAKKELMSGAFKSLSPEAKESFKKAELALNNVKAWSIRAYDHAAALVTKHSSRPTLGFIGFGAAVGLLSAFWYNVFQKIIKE